MSTGDIEVLPRSMSKVRSVVHDEGSKHTLLGPSVAPSQRRDRHRFRRGVGLVLAALALLAAACGSSDDDATEAAGDASVVADSEVSDETPAADEDGAAGSEDASPDATTATAEPTVQNEAGEAADAETEAPPEPQPEPQTDQEPPTAVAPQEPTTSTSAPEVLDDAETPLRWGLLDAGTVVLAEEFDVRVALTTDGGWKAAVVGSGAVVLEDVERVAPFTRGVLILSAAPVGAASVDEWAALRDDVTVEARREMPVSGYEAIVYDLTYDGEREAPVLTAPATFNGGLIVVRNTEYYRIWVIDIDADKPLVIFSVVLRDDLDWLEKAEGLVNSIKIG